jgi:hypothetical protein
MANITLNKISANSHIYDVTCASILSQGNLVVLGTQDNTTNLGTYTVAACSAITDLGMVLVASVPLNYEAEKVEGDYSLAIGSVGRAYEIAEGMVVTVENAQLTATATATVGHYVIPDASALKMEIVAALGGTEAKVFIIDEATTLNGVAASKIRCIKA